MISSVAIRRFKQIQDLSVPLSALTVLVGANNSGKSSVLQAIHFAVSLSQSAKLAGGVTWRNDQYELSLNPAQLLYSPVADVMALATGGKLMEAKAQQVEVTLTSSDGHSSTVAMSRGRNRNVAISITGRTIGEQLQSMDAPFSVYAPGLAGVPKDELYMSAGRVQRIVARGDANLVLRNVLWMLKRNTNQWRVFQDDIVKIFPGVSIDVNFNDQTDEYIKAEFCRNDGPMLPLDAAGTSLLQAAQLLSYVALFQPKILILDEPDSHLHPNNQRRFCRLLADLAENRGTQIIMSTHSRHMLDALKKASSLIWINNGSIVENAESDVTSLLLELGALDSADYFADKQLKYLVVTEDQDDSMLKALLWSSGYSSEDTEVVSYLGCSKMEAATVLGEFIRSKASNVVVIVHRDRDFMDSTDVAMYSERLIGSGLHPFVTEGSDVEWYFLNAEHLNQLNPEVSTQRFAELIEQSINDTRDKSIAAIVNFRTHEAFRKRANSAKQVDHGEIAVNAPKDFDGNPRSFSRGKDALSRLKSLFHQETGTSLKCLSPTPHVCVAELREILGASDSSQG